MVQLFLQQNCQNKHGENIFPINKKTFGKIHYNEQTFKQK